MNYLWFLECQKIKFGFVDGGKTETTAFYNSAKGGVGVLDQNVRHYFKYYKYKHAGFHILQYLDIREYSIYI